MKRMARGMAQVVSFALALVMTVCFVLSAVTMLAYMGLTDRDMHLSVAQHERVIALQEARVTAEIAEVAEECFFSTETIASVTGRETLMSYNAQVVDWWMGMIRTGTAENFPLWDHDDLETMIREDPLFQENVSTYQRKAFARDQAAGGVRRVIAGAVTPLRTDIVDLITTKLLPKVNVARIVSLLPLAAGACLGAAVALGLIIWLLNRGRRLAPLYSGSALAASALLLAGGALMAYLVDLPGLIGRMSELLALQTSLLQGAMMLRCFVMIAVLLAVGVALMVRGMKDKVRRA